MKTNNLFKTLMFAVMALIFVGITSCNNDDEPVKPTDETEDKGHEEWSKVTFTFHKGHLHGSTFHGDPVNENVKYFKSEQEFTFQYDEKGNLTSSTEPIRLIKGAYYALEITYFNKNGERMNSEFTNEINAPIHQHFFLTKDAKVLDQPNQPFAKADNIIGSYFYRDTKPEDKMYNVDPGVVLRGEKDPIGLKGYFTVNEVYTQFNLNVILVHVGKGNKFDKEGNPYPFNKPNKALLSIQDLNVSIPMRVYGEHPENDTDQLYEDMAKEFKITKEQAEADWDLQVSTPHDSGKYWM